MTVPDTKSGRKYSRSTWYTLTVGSWGITAMCGSIWIIASICNFTGVWITAVQLIAILGMALGALFLAAHQISDGGNGKKSLAVFMLFMFRHLAGLGLDAA